MEKIVAMYYKSRDRDVIHLCPEGWHDMNGRHITVCQRRIHTPVNVMMTLEKFHDDEHSCKQCVKSIKSIKDIKSINLYGDDYELVDKVSDK